MLAQNQVVSVSSRTYRSRKTWREKKKKTRNRGKGQGKILKSHAFTHTYIQRQQNRDPSLYPLSSFHCIFKLLHISLLLFSVSMYWLTAMAATTITPLFCLVHTQRNRNLHAKYKKKNKKQMIIKYLLSRFSLNISARRWETTSITNNNTDSFHLTCDFIWFPSSRCWYLIASQLSDDHMNIPNEF